MERKVLALSRWFLTFVVVGGAWVGLLRTLPEGTPRLGVVLLLGIAVTLVFVTLVILRVRKILGGPKRLWMQGLLLFVDLVLLLVAYAAMYHSLGIVDTTRPGSPVVYDFWRSLYLSVITFTTVGYGDFYPAGTGRVLAAMQGLTGYITLGVLASTVASTVSPHSPAGRAAAEEAEREDGEDRSAE